MNLLQEFLSYPGFVLEALLVILLLRGPFRQYKVLFFYLLTLLASSAVEKVVRLQYGIRSEAYRWTYWGFEVVVDLLLFVLVSTLIYRIIGDSPHRALIGKVLLGIAVAVMTLPLAIYAGRRMFSNAWFTGLSQFLNFGAGLMAFGLWGAVITSRTKDLRLLMVSAGLGLAVTGSAVSFGLQSMTAPGGVARNLAGVFGQLAFLASMVVWCWAFWRSWPTSSRSAPAVESPVPEVAAQAPPPVLHT